MDIPWRDILNIEKWIFFLQLEGVAIIVGLVKEEFVVREKPISMTNMKTLNDMVVEKVDIREQEQTESTCVIPDTEEAFHIMIH